jgi:hypothetical protein
MCFGRTFGEAKMFMLAIPKILGFSYRIWFNAIYVLLISFYQPTDKCVTVQYCLKTENITCQSNIWSQMTKDVSKYISYKEEIYINIKISKIQAPKFSIFRLTKYVNMVKISVISGLWRTSSSRKIYAFSMFLQLSNILFLA